MVFICFFTKIRTFHLTAIQPRRQLEVSGAKYEERERAREKTRDAACNDALAFSQILFWLLPNTSYHSPLTISFGCLAVR